jgi:DNA-3-methyladenine glycosylase II
VARTLKAAAKLAAADPVMAELVERVGPLAVDQRRRGRPTDDLYGALLRTIVGQQLSVAAARTIYGRVLDIYDGEVPTPKQVLATEVADLRGAGLSGRKAEYIRDLAAHVESGELEIDRLREMPDEEVIAEIVAVRGLGRWSADMFLMFTLGRPDVLPVDDLGIRRAIKLAYGLDELPAAAEMERIAEPWRPHRTLACMYLWESLSAAPVE